MLSKIKFESEFIALEAASSTAGLLNALDRLPNFITIVKGQFLQFVGKDEPEEVPASYSKLAKKIAQVRYTDLAPLRVYTPPGLKTTYLDYLKSLEEAEKTILAIPKEVIGPFSFWIAQLLNNPQEMSSQRTHFEVKGLVLPDTEKLQKLIMKGVVGGDKQTEQPYSKVVGRNKDWGEIEQCLERLNHHMVGSDRKKIIQEVDVLTTNIDTLVERVKEDPEEYSFSGPALTLLSKTCYDVAKVLEAYSVYCYQLRLTTVAIEDTQKYLSSIVDKVAQAA